MFSYGWFWSFKNDIEGSLKKDQQHEILLKHLFFKDKVFVLSDLDILKTLSDIKKAIVTFHYIPVQKKRNFFLV
jgi:hypothetical protein